VRGRGIITACLSDLGIRLAISDLRNWVRHQLARAETPPFERLGFQQSTEAANAVYPRISSALT
jgi:hypothetical protein